MSGGCSVPGCAATARARGICNRHYKIMRAAGTQCAVEDCPRHVGTRGLCSMHYTRLMRHGDLLGGGRSPRGEAIAYYVEHVACSTTASPQCDCVDPQTGCKSWPYARSDGYGVLRINGQNKQVHVLACEAAHGAQPPNKQWALHLCLGAAAGCWSGSHVVWGTPADNNGAHKRRDGTILFGETAPSAKLRESQVLEIRARYAAGCVFQRELAAEFGVTRSAVQSIVRRRTWPHL